MADIASLVVLLTFMVGALILGCMWASDSEGLELLVASGNQLGCANRLSM